MFRLRLFSIGIYMAFAVLSIVSEENKTNQKKIGTIDITIKGKLAEQLRNTDVRELIEQRLDFKDPTEPLKKELRNALKNFVKVHTGREKIAVDKKPLFQTEKLVSSEESEREEKSSLSLSSSLISYKKKPKSDFKKVDDTKRIDIDTNNDGDYNIKIGNNKVEISNGINKKQALRTKPLESKLVREILKIENYQNQKNQRPEKYKINDNGNNKQNSNIKKPARSRIESESEKYSSSDNDDEQVANNIQKIEPKAKNLENNSNEAKASKAVKQIELKSKNWESNKNKDNKIAWKKSVPAVRTPIGIAPFSILSTNIQRMPNKLQTRVESKQKQKNIHIDGDLKKQRDEATALRQAYGGACLKLVISKCYKACQKAGKEACDDRKCREKILPPFLNYAKTKCLDAFNGRASKTGRNDHDDDSMDITRTSDMTAACVTVQASGLLPTTPQNSDALTSLRSKYERACQKETSSKCEAACTSAFAQACGDNCRIKYKSPCKRRCEDQYVKASKKSGSSSDSESDSGRDSDNSGSDSSD